MPVFEYKALDAKGRSSGGVVDADTPRDAREKLRLQKIYVTTINEVRGAGAKRTVVKDQATGDKKIVVKADAPMILQAAGMLAFLGAGAEVIQLVLRYRAAQATPELVKGATETVVTFTTLDVVVGIVGALASAMFGYAIIRGKAWALTVTAVFGFVNILSPFALFITENEYAQVPFVLLFAAQILCCILAWAKMKDEGLGEGNDKINSLSQVSAVTRQLATLLHSGIPLAQALNAVIEQAESPSLEKVLRHLREQVTQGTDFASALETCPAYFNSLYINMVRAGQASGQLDEVLTRIADYLANQNRLKNKVISAMMYPAIMLTISTLVVILLMTFVVPRITEVLIAQNVPLPLPTQVLVVVSDFMSTYWQLCLKLPLIAYFFFQGAMQADKFRQQFDRLMLRLPLFGDLLKKTAVSRFAVTFAVLLRSGLPALDSLRIVKKIVGNKALQAVIQEVHDSIVEGSDISTPIKKSGVFPPVVGYMVAVGEQTGELEQLLERIATAYDEEVDIAITRMTALIEPIMIVFMAVVVGGIVAAVIIPLLQMSTAGMGK